jgi:hypothetical protein
MTKQLNWIGCDMCKWGMYSNDEQDSAPAEIIKFHKEFIHDN